MNTFERFAAEAYPSLVAALGHQFGDRYLAEDLAQEALVRAREHWGRVGVMDSPVGWAFRVGCNLGNTVMRRRATERRALRLRAAGQDLAVQVDPDTPDRLAVHEALQHLSPAQRTAVIARFFLGLSGPEAAEALGTTANSHRVQLHRGLAKLREHLDLPDPEAADVP